MTTQATAQERAKNSQNTLETAQNHAKNKHIP